MNAHRLGFAVTLLVSAAGFCAVARAAEEKQAASVSGTWKWSRTFNDNTLEFILKLKQDGEKLAGTLVVGESPETAIENGKVAGADISFSITQEFNGAKMTRKYSGKIEGDTIKGKTEFERDGQTQSRDWEAKRVAQSAQAGQPAAPVASQPAAPARPAQRWVNPQPDVPYLPKPAPRPADWVVEHEPVTPNASPEARALLKFLYGISTKHTLTGQHNFAANQGQFTSQALRVTGKTPALYGTDWGSARGEIGEARDRIVQAVIREHQKGSIIAICWHEVRPSDDEPATFQQSVRAKLTNAEFDELITPGTALHKRWLAQVDVVAGYMKQLRDARVPILWRPFHEINGDWFWWNGRRGERGSKQLYRLMFDRLVNYHKLNNLLWVWNPDRPEREDRQFVDYFPGQQYVDVLSLDTYAEYKQSYYDDLNALSDGKPMAVSECGRNVPPLDVFATQPKWTYYMVWAGFLGRPGGKGAGGPGFGGPGAKGPMGPDLPSLVKDPRMWSLDDPAYREAIAPTRAASGLPATRPAATAAPTRE
jgi:mannan endo-1,4-beta-mannosidase